MCHCSVVWQDPCSSPLALGGQWRREDSKYLSKKAFLLVQKGFSNALTLEFAPAHQLFVQRGRGFIVGRGRCMGLVPLSG